MVQQIQRIVAYQDIAAIKLFSLSIEPRYAGI